MAKSVFSFVSKKEVEEYFKSDVFRQYKNSEHTLEYYNDRLEFWFDAKSVTYDVTIESTEDELDRGKISGTEDPVDFIMEFLGSGEGSELFKKASSPESLSKYLIKLSSNLLDRTSSVRKLRRIAAAISANKHNIFSLKSLIAFDADALAEETDALLEQLEKNKWKVKKVKTDADLWVIEVNIMDLYKATIKPNSIKWKYSIRVRGVDGSQETGFTDDPIKVYRHYHKSEKYQNAKAELSRIKRLEDEVKTKKPEPAKFKKEDFDTVKLNKNTEDIEDIEDYNTEDVDSYEVSEMDEYDILNKNMSDYTKDLSNTDRKRKVREDNKRIEQMERERIEELEKSNIELE